MDRQLRAMAHIDVDVTQWGQDGRLIQSASVPGTVYHLAPWLSFRLNREVFAVTIESPYGRGLIHLREGWAPPRLTPLWERWLDVDLEVIDWK